MRSYVEQENITVVEGPHGVSFCFEDGSTAELPRDVANNSSIPETALAETPPGELVSLKLPAGVLQKWLQCVGEEPYVKILWEKSAMYDTIIDKICRW